MNEIFNGAEEIASLLLDKGAELQQAEDTLAIECEALSKNLKEINGVMYRWDRSAHKWTPMDIAVPQDMMHPRAL